LLLCVDKHLWSCCFRIINPSNSFSFNLVYYNLLLTLCLSDSNWSLFLCFNFQYFSLCLCLDFRLLLINFCSFNLLVKLIHFSLIVSLECCKILLLFIFNRQFFVFLIFNMVLESIFNNCFLLKSIAKLWVNNDICYITLIKNNSVRLKFTI
jgi:hypothetical protein